MNVQLEHYMTNLAESSDSQPCAETSGSSGTQEHVVWYESKRTDTGTATKGDVLLKA